MINIVNLKKHQHHNNMKCLQIWMINIQNNQNKDNKEIKINIKYKNNNKINNNNK